MQTIWILVADRIRARLFTPSDDGETLVELEDFVNPGGRKPDRANGHGKPPRTQESVGSARHAIEPKTSAAEKAEQRFARELNEMLECGRVDHRFRHLIIAAPPRFLGTLRRTMDDNVQACVLAEVNKDLSAMSLHNIRTQLARQLANSIKMSHVG
jgi:protein required for attachment to host cells